jgi:hypothetical protein
MQIVFFLKLIKKACIGFRLFCLKFSKEVLLKKLKINTQTGAGCAVNRVPKDMLVQECCMKDDSRPITVAVQAEAVNRLSVLV